MTTSFQNIILIVILALIWTCDVHAQSKDERDLNQHISTYKDLLENVKKDKHLRKTIDLVQEVSRDSIQHLMELHQYSFMARLAMADYLRSNKEPEAARTEYKKLERDVLKSHPIDYTLLTIIYWNKSLAFSMENFSYDDEIKDYEIGLAYAKKSMVDTSIMLFHSNLSFMFNMTADYEQYVYHNKKRYDIAVNMNDTFSIVLTLKNLMNDYWTTDDGESAVKVWHQIQPMLRSDYASYGFSTMLFSEVTNAFIKTNQLDSAAYYNLVCIRTDSIQGKEYRKSYNTINKGKILFRKGMFKEAELTFTESYNLAKENKQAQNQAISSMYLAKIYLDDNQSDRALTVLKSSYLLRKRYRNYNKAEIEIWLSKAYEAKNMLDSALIYRKKSEESFKIEKRTLAEKQVALAKAELEITEIIDENRSLETLNKDLDERISTSTKTRKTLVISGLLASLLTGLFLYHKNQQEKLRASMHKEQIANKERIAIEAELNAIRSQMNPHFMFNSLNSINEYIQNDSSDDASHYLVKFSKLMRSTLNYSKKKFVTLKEEIDLLKLYVELENLRFSNSIDFKLVVDPNMDINRIQIPPMMLQPYVENAIWHGLMPKENDRILSLHLSENDHNLICQIDDNGIGRKASADKKLKFPGHQSQGMGLTQRRLELLKNIYGVEAGVQIQDLEARGIASGTSVEVILPKKMNA